MSLFGSPLKLATVRREYKKSTTTNTLIGWHLALTIARRKLLQTPYRAYNYILDPNVKFDNYIQTVHCDCKATSQFSLKRPRLVVLRNGWRTKTGCREDKFGQDAASIRIRIYSLIFKEQISICIHLSWILILQKSRTKLSVLLKKFIHFNWMYKIYVTFYPLDSIPDVEPEMGYYSFTNIRVFLPSYFS